MSKYNELLELRFEALTEYLGKILPHGSGIDCKWTFDLQKNGKVICYNSYHCMNGNGYYDGYADFKIKLPLLKSMKAFDLVFTGKQASYLNTKYQLRDYLEDTFYHTLPDRSIYECLICE